MNTGKMLVVLILTIAAALMPASLKAAQPWATGTATSIWEVGMSTPAATPMLISAGAGSLQTATISSSTVGGNCVFFDSASVSGITSVDQNGTNTAPRLGEVFFITANTPASLPPVTNAARPFRNGLVALCSHLARLTVIGSRN